MRILFGCGRASARSPTAEQVRSRWPGLQTASAGVSDESVEAGHSAWAETIVVMERAHRRRLMRRFGPALRQARIVCLDVRDDYAFMEPALVRLLEVRSGRFLPYGRTAG